MSSQEGQTDEPLIRPYLRCDRLVQSVTLETTPAWIQPTQREVADFLGITQKAVWETEQRALRKLREAMDYDDWRELLET